MEINGTLYIVSATYYLITLVTSMFNNKILSLLEFICSKPTVFCLF